MSDETPVLRKIWLAVAATTTLFRLNTGSAWVGKGRPKKLADGSVLIPYARPISVGLSFPNTKPVKGPSDLIGWTTRIITQEMVGQKIAQFTTIEAKNSKGGERSDAQILWADNITKAGGIAIFASSPEQAQEQIRQSIGR